MLPRVTVLPGFALLVVVAIVVAVATAVAIVIAIMIVIMIVIAPTIPVVRDHSHFATIVAPGVLRA